MVRSTLEGGAGLYVFVGHGAFACRTKGQTMVQSKGPAMVQRRKVNHHTISRWRELSAHGLSGLCLSVVSLVPSFEWSELVAPGTVFWVECSFLVSLPRVHPRTFKPNLFPPATNFVSSVLILGIRWQWWVEFCILSYVFGGLS